MTSPAVVMLQQAPSGGGGLFELLMLMGPIFLIFYFLVIRPQSRQRRQHESMLKTIEKGDAVVTTGGIHGNVSGVTDEVLTIDIATVKGGDRVRVKVQRGRIESVTKAKGGAEK